MKKNKKWIVVGMAILVIGMLLVWKCWNAEEIIQEDTEAVEEVIVLTDEEKGPISGESSELYDAAEAFIVEQVLRTQTETEDGSIETYYGSYIQAEVNLVEGNDVTIDYTQASVGSDFQLEEAVTIEFSEAFGFDYRGMSGADIYEQLLWNAGIDKSLDEVTFDESTYEMTGQEIYVLENECEIINQLLQDVSYDELIGTEVSYQMLQGTEESSNEYVIPEFYTAMVQYEVDGTIVTKNLFLQISIVNTDANED